MIPLGVMLGLGLCSDKVIGSPWVGEEKGGILDTRLPPETEELLEVGSGWGEIRVRWLPVRWAQTLGAEFRCIACTQRAFAPPEDPTSGMSQSPQVWVGSGLGWGRGWASPRSRTVPLVERKPQPDTGSIIGGPTLPEIRRERGTSQISSSTNLYATSHPPSENRGSGFGEATSLSPGVRSRSAAS